MADDCFKWNEAGHGDTKDMQLFPSNVSTSGGITTIQFTGQAQNPLEPDFAPSIYWNMQVVINESNPAGPTAYVVPDHTCYPAHIVKVNGTIVYSYIPGFNDPGFLTMCLTKRIPLVTLQEGTYQVNTQ